MAELPDKTPKQDNKYRPPKGVVPPQFGGTRRALNRTAQGADLRFRLFAKQFVACKFNGKAAAIMCGYSPVNAENQAKAMLRDPRVIQLLDEEFEKIVKKHDLTIDAVVMELKALGFSNMLHYVRKEGETYVLDMSETTPEQMSAIHEIVWEERVVKTQDLHDADLGPVRETVTDRRTRLKLHPKHAPLQDLLKHLGGFLGKGSAPGEGDVTNVFMTNVNITAQDASREYQALVSGRRSG